MVRIQVKVSELIKIRPSESRAKLPRFAHVLKQKYYEIVTHLQRIFTGKLTQRFYVEYFVMTG